MLFCLMCEDDADDDDNDDVDEGKVDDENNV